eukprot:gene2087-2226_t
MSFYDVCPAGFDCQAASSCPSYTVPCPDGYFCSSYEGNRYESDLDFQYASTVTRYLHDPIDITNRNKKNYVDPDRAIQSACLSGFYCPNATTILPCPSGHWCPPNTVQPRKCDALSLCGERSAYQFNFVNFLIMMILVIIAFSASSFLRGKQESAEEIARKREPNVPTVVQKEEVQADQVVSEFKHGSIEIVFNDIHLQYSKDSKIVLPNVSGMVPAGQISAILGPTSSGKSSLLNILRLGYTDNVVSKGNIKVRVRNTSTNHSWTLDKSLVRNFVGYVPQEDVFDRDLTVRYNVGEETSDADFCVDVLNGLNDVVVESDDDGDEQNQVEMVEVQRQDKKVLDANNLHLLWKSIPLSTSIEEGEVAMIDEVTSVQYEIPIEHHSQSLYSSLMKSSYYIYINGERLIKVRLRNTFELILYIQIGVVQAVALSSAFTVLINHSYASVYNTPTPLEFYPFNPPAVGVLRERAGYIFVLSQMLFFMSAAVGTASCLATIPVFAGKLSVVKREKAGGSSVLSYAIGRILADLFFVILNAFVFVGVWCCFGHSGAFYNWMAVILCTAFAGSGIGYISGVLVSENSANVFAIILTFIFCVFDGVDPTFKQINKLPVINWLWHLSFATWTAEAAFFTWTEYTENFGKLNISVQDAADKYGFDVSHGLNRSVGALLALGIGLRIIAIFILWWKAK